MLNTQTTLFSDEDALAQVRVSRFLAIVALYRALGGGWDLGSDDIGPHPAQAIHRENAAHPATAIIPHPEHAA